MNADLRAYSIALEQKCRNKSKHTKTPDGYAEMLEWMKAISKTHNQKQCQECGLWAIWECKECEGEEQVPSGVEHFGMLEMMPCPTCQIPCPACQPADAGKNGTR